MIFLAIYEVWKYMMFAHSTIDMQNIAVGIMDKIVTPICTQLQPPQTKS